MQQFKTLQVINTKVTKCKSKNYNFIPRQLYYKNKV